MATPSQASYAARLARAEQFYQFISTFQNYNPGIPELTPEGFQNLVTQLSSTQSQHTVTHHEFSEAVRLRKKTFMLNPDSLTKTLTLVNSYIRAKNGVTSQQYIDVNSFVKKIRGEKPVPVTANSTQDSISRSERSYGSQLQNFSDIITLLQQFGPEYDPANVAIKIPALNTLHTHAATANNTVTHKFSAYQPKINERRNGFKTLADTTSRIKEMVKAQYGSTSEEYKLIKGLNFSV
ncbi:hypothetical protein FSS13T_18930 [Flavobacterium saliperosum S13]|uniref:Uncharacterized protein n=2 Tax=Flavobacterium saliperosum TaxID=329186 RepID=A0A1G4W7Y1_9FLAO|nr:hypothetical protein [Flavobacterium saliperosum]ESU24663.1 hypothetical protein FSS13T_18930 [Flavobacterium saliperosum S13]SCX18261.1 hypothetical protein SAMN02927925_02654 [Flavobacterium saliperosum]